MPADDPQEILERFFAFAADEDFDRGFAWAVDGLAQFTDLTLDRIIGQDPPERNGRSSSSAIVLSGQARLFAFAACYFKARHLIEISVYYQEATDLLDAACAFLEREPRPEEPAPGLVEILVQYTGLITANLRVDHGLYTEDEALLAQAAEEALGLVRKIDALEGSLEDVGSAIFEKYIRPIVKSHRLYAEGVALAAELYALRWSTDAADAGATAEGCSRLEQIVHQLHELGSFIMARDLKPLLTALRRFHEVRGTDDGALLVNSGSVIFRNYAWLEHGLRERLAECVRDRSLALDLGIGEPIRAREDLLADTWSRVNSDAMSVFTWDLPDLEFRIRNGSVAGTVKLKYYNLGILAIEVRVPLHHMRIAEVRHLMSLAMPYALDEDLRWHVPGAKSGYARLRQFFHDLYGRMSAWIGRELTSGPLSPASPLQFAERGATFVCLRADELREQRPSGGERRLNGSEFVSHLERDALIMPLRELRTTIDSWLLRHPDQHAINLAPLRYDRFDTLVVRRQEAIVVMPDQPLWVIDQVEDSVLFGSAIVNFYRLTNAVFSREFARTIEQLGSLNGVGKLKFRQLRRQQAVLQARLARFEAIELGLQQLIGLVEAGRLTTFADHTDFMRAIFEQMDLGAYRDRSQEILAQVRTYDEQLLNSVDAMQDRIRNRRNRRVTGFVSGALLFISAIQLTSLFDLWNRAGIGAVISAREQVYFFLTLFILATMLLVVNMGKRD